MGAGGIDPWTAFYAVIGVIGAALSWLGTAVYLLAQRVAALEAERDNRP